MSRRMITPSNLKVLTNVAVVRYRTHGCRFELACYPNKVSDYRSGLEKDIDEVLQTDKVFTNVSKGVFAKDADLRKGFNTVDHKEAALVILQKGELQVSAKERGQEKSALLKEIATIVSGQTINPDTATPYPINVLLREIAALHYNATAAKPAKVQAVEVIRLLQGRIPIERNLFEAF